jgi:hypothetical protein
MNNQTAVTTEKAILINFQIGRGGRFYNGGHLSVNGIGEHTLSHITETLNYDYSSLSESIKELDDEAKSQVLDATTDDSSELETILIQNGLSLADIGERCYTDQNGSVYDLPNDTGYSFDFDGEYNSSYGVYITQISELDNKQISALQDYGQFYEIEELFTTDQYIMIDTFGVTIEDAIWDGATARLKVVTEEEYHEESEDGEYKRGNRGMYYFLAAE